MRLRLLSAAAAAALTAACSSGGAEKKEAPGTKAATECYKEAGKSFTQPASEHALFVIVDQTTALDEHLRQTLEENVRGLLQPGTEYSIYTFSAYSRGRYLTPVLSGELAAPVPEDERGDLPVRRLSKLDRCLDSALQNARSEVESALKSAEGEDSASFANSEILASLQQVSEAVRESRAGEKLVIVASDLLEHSSATSFYKKKQVRAIDPEAELAKANSARLIADFGGAKVAVIGAGLLSPESGSASVRNTAALQSLHDFWAAWFKASNGELVKYGQPDLPTPLGW